MLLFFWRELVGRNVIAYIQGQVLFIEANFAVVLANGVGYQLLLCKRDLDTCQTGKEMCFHVFTNVREDAIELYGFSNQEQKQLFQLLISVSGVGPKLALAMLSHLASNELIEALLSKNLAVLSSIPGIGKKTAERLALELKDKVAKFDLPISLSAPSLSLSLQQALKSLGYSRDQCEKAIAKIPSEEFSALPLESLIKKSLQLLTGTK